MSLITAYKKLTSQKKPIENAGEKKFCQITCIVGGAISLISMILMLIATAGFSATYVWSALIFGLAPAAFFALAYFRYATDNALINRFSDASVYLTVFGVYTPIQLSLIQNDVYENGSIVCAWVLFGLVALASAFFFVSSLIATRRFRLTGAFFYILMAGSIFFGIFALLNAYYFAPALLIVLLSLTVLAFAATPIIFWFFDSKAWQMRVFYILMASATLLGSLISVIWAFAGR